MSHCQSNCHLGSSWLALWVPGGGGTCPATEVCWPVAEVLCLPPVVVACGVGPATEADWPVAEVPLNTEVVLVCGGGCSGLPLRSENPPTHAY